MVSIVYMVAGMSSRFGGKIKQFAKIGSNDETLIEISMNQAKEAGFDKIIFIVGEKTKEPFKEKFGDFYKKIPIFYAEQIFDVGLRDKPWGTVDALISAKKLINENFVVCNGDDIYGVNSLKIAKKFLEKTKTNSDVGCAIGYELKKVLPKKGKTNRGIFKTDKNNNVLEIKEIFDIEKNKLIEINLNENDLTSMNLFGLTPTTLTLLEKNLIEFKKINLSNRKIECLLPEEIGKLIKNKNLKMKLFKTNDEWFGVTNPEDEEKLRSIFSKK